MVTLMRRFPTTAFFLAAYALTWSVWVPRALAQRGPLDWRWPVAAGQVWSYGPALAAVVVTAAVAGRPGLRRLGGALARWRVGWRWWTIVLLGPFALSGCAVALHASLTGQTARWPVARPAELLVYPVLILILALTDGLGEEVGWRGCALFWLLRRRGAAAASIILAILWAVWHLPLFWTDRAPLEGRPFPLLMLALIPTSILFTWVYRHTGSSVLVAIVLHATHNLAGPPLPRADESLLTPFVLAVSLKWALATVVLLAESRRPQAERIVHPPAEEVPA